jgi:hypothetical protein
MKKSTKKAARTLTPREARTFAQIERLPRGNVEAPGFWVLLGGSGNPLEITITKQRAGEKAEAMLTLKRHDFERVVDWYNTGKWRRR